MYNEGKQRPKQVEETGPSIQQASTHPTSSHEALGKTSLTSIVKKAPRFGLNGKALIMQAAAEAAASFIPIRQPKGVCVYFMPTRGVIFISIIRLKRMATNPDHLSFSVLIKALLFSPRWAQQASQSEPSPCAWKANPTCLDGRCTSRTHPPEGPPGSHLRTEVVIRGSRTYVREISQHLNCLKIRLFKNLKSWLI